MFHHKCPHPYHQTKRQRLIERNTLVVVIAGLILLFIAGRFSVKSSEEYQTENKRLSRSIEEVSGVNKELIKRQDFADNSRQIDLQATKESRLSLTKLHSELSEVKELLAFYQRVVAPEALREGLYINSFDLEQDGENGSYRYRLVVAQGTSQRRALKGTYALSVTGRLKGKDKVLSLKEMSKSSTHLTTFLFRYYEILSGDISLPDGFVPAYIKVKINASTKKRKVVEQQWAWSELV